MTLNLKRILWPTDFSELSLRAAEYARAFRSLCGAELHIIHVSPLLAVPISAPAPSLTIELCTYEDQCRQLAEEQLHRLVIDQFGNNQDIVCQVLSGNAWWRVCEYAREVGIDLIIVATHGLTGLRHVLIGSTAERIVQHAPCPLLTVKAIEKGFCIGDGRLPQEKPA